MEENEKLEIEPAENASAAEIEHEEPGNLDICPNCLEPNTDNLAVCKYCGMPLHQGADPDAFTAQETEAELAANRAAAVPEEKKPAKKQENGFRRVMPWLGLYLIYYAITGCFDVKRQIEAAKAEGQPVNETLAYVAQLIWFAAGLMMAWPLIKKGWRKLRHLPDEEEEQPAEEQAEQVAGTDADETNAESAEAEAETADEELPAVAEIREEAAETEQPSAETGSAEPVSEELAYMHDRLVSEDGTGEENEEANWL